MLWIVLLLIVITALLAIIVGLLISASQAGLRQDMANLRAEVSGLKSIEFSPVRRIKANRIRDQLAEVENDIKRLVQEMESLARENDREADRKRRSKKEREAMNRQLEQTAEKLSEMRDALLSLLQ